MINNTPPTKGIGFELSVSERDNGTLEAVYITLHDEPSVRTEEVVEDVLFADYNAAGELIGIEILAPVRLGDLTHLVEPARRTPFARFVERRVPHEFVHP